MNTQKLDNPPAFPGNAPIDYFGYAKGMTLRDWFAGHIFGALIEIYGPKECATKAYQYADAMLAARAKENNE